jgi:hypothetical protein
VLAAAVVERLFFLAQALSMNKQIAQAKARDLFIELDFI